MKKRVSHNFFLLIIYMLYSSAFLLAEIHSTVPRDNRLVIYDNNTADINWDCTYIVLLNENKRSASFAGRIALQNQSGVTYSNMTITVARKSEGFSYDLQEKHSLYAKGEVVAEYIKANGAPIEHTYIFDGITLDHFDRDPQKDRNYGIQSKKTIDSYIAFANKSSSGLGVPLPHGRLFVYQKKRDYIGSTRESLTCHILV